MTIDATAAPATDGGDDVGARERGLSTGEDVFVAFSAERIDPGRADFRAREHASWNVSSR